MTWRHINTKNKTYSPLKDVSEKIFSNWTVAKVTGACFSSASLDSSLFFPHTGHFHSLRNPCKPKSTIKKEKPINLCAPHEFKTICQPYLIIVQSCYLIVEYTNLSLRDLRFLLCSLELDVLRAQRVTGFLIVLPTNQRGRKIQSHGWRKVCKSFPGVVDNQSKEDVFLFVLLITGQPLPHVHIHVNSTNIHSRQQKP